MKNKILSIFITFSFIALFIFSCQEEYLTAGEENNTTKPPITNSDFGFRSSNAFEDSIEILYLGSIDLIFLSDLRDSIAEESQSDDSYEKVSFSKIRSIATNLSMDLIDTMKYSVINNGGTQAQADRIEELLNGFTYNGNTYYPIIYFPFSDSTLSASDVVIAEGKLSEPSSLTGIKYGTGTSIAVTKTVAEANQFWLITADDIGTTAGWLPWRKCFCSRGAETPDGDTSSYGFCNQISSSVNRCNTKCGRSDFSGDDGSCPNTNCPGC